MSAKSIAICNICKKGTHETGVKRPSIWFTLGVIDLGLVILPEGLVPDGDIVDIIAICDECAKKVLPSQLRKSIESLVEKYSTENEGLVM